MPQIEVWARLPVAIREHLIERMYDRKISIEDLNGCESGSNPGQAYLKAIGIRISAPSNFVEKALIQRHFCFPAN